MEIIYDIISEEVYGEVAYQDFSEYEKFFKLVKYLENEYGLIFLYRRHDIEKFYEVGFTNYSDICILRKHKSEFTKAGCIAAFEFIQILNNGEEKNGGSKK